MDWYPNITNPSIIGIYHFLLLLPLTAKGQTDTLSSIEPTTNMKEVAVKASKILMVQNGDTLVYNADQLQLSAGAMLDELINELPEVRISTDGVISVKGEPVAELLIEGRDFFHGDPTIALKNLPAFTVKKVKVYRRVPREAYLTREDKGLKARETDPLVMDVRLKPLYQNGVIANVESASGVPTQGDSKYLYLERLFGLHYNERRSLSGYIGMNNVNDTGKPQSKGMWRDQQNEMGEQRHTIAGIDFTYKNPQSNATANGMFRLDDSRNNQWTEYSGLQYLTNSELHSLSINRNNVRNLNASWSGEGFYPAKAFTISVRPRLSISKSNSLSSNRSATFSEQKYGTVVNLIDSIYRLSVDDYYCSQNAVNRQEQLRESEGSSVDIGLIARSTIRPSSFKQPLTVFLTGDYWSNKLTENGENRIDYASGSGESVNKLQYNKSPSSSFVWNLDVSHTVWSSLDKNNIGGRLDISLRSDLRTESSERRLYNLDELAQTYAWGDWEELLDENLLKAVIDTTNSYICRSKEYNQTLSANFAYQFTKRVGSSISVPFILKSRSLRDERVTSDIRITKHNCMTAPSLSIRLGNFAIGYSYRTVLPNLSDIADRTDNSDPLVVSIGNSTLKSSQVHTPNLGFSRQIFKNKAYISIRADFQTVRSAIKRMFYYDPSSGATTVQSRNIDGDWRLDLNGRYQHSFGKKSQWQFAAATQATVENDNVYDNKSSAAEVTKYAAKRSFITGEGDLTYNLKDWRFSLHGDYKWRHTKSLQGRFNNVNYVNIRYGGAIRTPVFHGLSLTTDFFVRTDAGLKDDKLNRSYLIWNANAKYDLNSKWSFLLEGVDLLRQLTSVSMGSGTTGWSETKRNTRPSYFLVHAIYRFNLLPKRNVNTNPSHSF